MSINISDIVFPDYVTGVKDIYGEWFKGGYDYQTQNPGWVRMFFLKEVKQFAIADYMTEPSSSEVVIETEYINVFTFPNGYYLGVKFIQSLVSGSGYVNVLYTMFDNEGNEVTDTIPGFSYSGSSSIGISADASILGLVTYITPVTVYYPQANPAAGSTNNGFIFKMFCGWPDLGFYVNLNNYTIPNTGRLQLEPNIAAWSSFDDFDDYLRNNGEEFEGDVFTDEEVPGEPAGGGDTSGTGGGGGNYDPTSDPIDFPSLPTGGPLTSGMIKGFVMNSGNLQGLQSKLWDMSIFDITTQFQKLVTQPLDCLISLHCLPFTPTEGSSEEIKLGSFPTTIEANRIVVQYMEIDAGSISVSEYWGSALDYAPYTQVEIFVPFVGFRNLKIEDIQGLTLALKYHVDVLTGDCVAYLKCGSSVLYSWTGNCLTKIPCSATSSDRLARGISAVGSVGVGLVTGNPAAAAAGAITGAVNTSTAKTHVQRSGDVAGSSGIMSEFVPYLVFHRPKQSLAKGYNTFKGYSSNITYTLNSLKGYTEVQHIHLTGITGATDTELNEIEQLLKSGVII